MPLHSLRHLEVVRALVQHRRESNTPALTPGRDPPANNQMGRAARFHIKRGVSGEPETFA
jgi:hypothetical protein